MNDARIEQALRLGPPEPGYQPVDLGLLLAGGRGRITMSNATRRVFGGAVVLASAAVIVALVVILGFRPNEPSLIGGSTSTPTAVPAVASTSTPAPSASQTSAATPFPTAVPTPGASAPASQPTSTLCRLEWGISGVEGAAGSRYINVDVTNTGTRVGASQDQQCIFAAIIGVTLKAADHSVIAQSDSPNSPAIMLDPNQKLTGFAQWTNWCGPQAPTHLTLVFEVDTTMSPVNAVDFVADPPPCTSPGEGSAITPIHLSSAQ